MKIPNIFSFELPHTTEEVATIISALNVHSSKIFVRGIRWNKLLKLITTCSNFVISCL